MNDNEENEVESEYVKADYEIGANLSTVETSDTRHLIERNIEFKHGENKKEIIYPSKVITKIVFYIVIILCVILMLVGISMFLLSMPGIAMENLKKLSNKIGHKFNDLYTKDNVNVDDDNIYDVLNYLKDMGYDLKGFGFLTNYVDRDSNGNLKDGVDDGLLLYNSGKKDGKIKEAESDYLLYYLISDNYLYSFANNESNNKKGLAGVIDKLGNSEAWDRMKDLIKNVYPKWGTGLLGVYIDGGDSGFGDKGAPYNSVFNWNNIEYSEEKKQLIVKRTWDKADVKYNMSGWTGRYGVPIEFLLSVHISTLMPDLSYDIATSFDSEIVMLLHKFGEGNLVYGSTTELVSGTINALSNEELSRSEGGAVSASDEVSTNTAYEYVQRGSIEAAASEDPEIRKSSGLGWDRDYALAVLAAMDKAAGIAKGKYDVYIARVENHWFRNIYFVLDNNDKILSPDTDYEHEYNERYAKYNEDGAETITPNRRLNKYGWQKVFGKWSAYYDSNPEGSVYINAFENPSNPIEANIFAEVYSGNHIVQKGDAFRGPTNPEIKNMFTTNEYIRYDGSPQTASLITELREKENIGYGAIKKNGSLNGISSNTYNKEVKLSDGKYHKLSEFTSPVSFTQDALNIFGMLENTHTLDSDYVYRDFKELAIELGYYEKSEVTNEVPRFLQFIVSRIGSYGYPIRALDKNSNEYGTLLHAKVDYQAGDYQQISEQNNVASSNETNQDLYLASNTYEKNTGLENKVQELEYSYNSFISSFDGSVDASPYDISDPRYEGSQGLLLKQYEENIAKGLIEDPGRDKLREQYLASNENKETNTLIDSMQAVRGKKRVLLAGSGGDYSVIEKDFTNAEWDDILEIVTEEKCLSYNVNTISHYYAKGDETAYKEWLKSLGGVFEEYAGKNKKTGGDTVEEFTDACKYVYGLMSLMGFEYCNGDPNHDGSFMEWRHGGYQCAYACPLDAYSVQGVGVHGEHYNTVQIDNCMLNHSFLTCCNFTVDKVYKKAGLMGGEGQPSSSCSYVSMVEKFGAEIVTQPCDLHIGDIIECFEIDNHDNPNPHSWTGWGHVMFVGEETEDTITLYSTGHDYTAPGKFRYVVNKSDDRNSANGLGNWKGWVGLHLWDLSSGRLYEGYEGNEAVVSPVTGVLLEYGKYGPEHVDSVTGENYRVNADLKYNTNKNEIRDLGFGELTVQDNVGYAKILVLDPENYQKLEKYTKNKWNTDSNSLLKIDNTVPTFREVLKNKDEEKSLSQLNKTIYGYKEFAEEYYKYGVSGYIIYIDGFAPEEPRQKE